MIRLLLNDYDVAFRSLVCSWLQLSRNTPGAAAQLVVPAFPPKIIIRVSVKLWLCGPRGIVHGQRTKFEKARSRLYRSRHLRLHTKKYLLKHSLRFLRLYNAIRSTALKLKHSL